MNTTGNDPYHHVDNKNDVNELGLVFVIGYWDGTLVSPNDVALEIET